MFYCRTINLLVIILTAIEEIPEDASNSCLARPTRTRQEDSVWKPSRVHELLERGYYLPLPYYPLQRPWPIPAIQFHSLSFHASQEFHRIGCKLQLIIWMKELPFPEFHFSFLEPTTALWSYFIFNFWIYNQPSIVLTQVNSRYFLDNLKVVTKFSYLHITYQAIMDLSNHHALKLVPSQLTVYLDQR